MVRHVFACEIHVLLKTNNYCILILIVLPCISLDVVIVVVVELLGCCLMTNPFRKSGYLVT